MPSNGTNLGQTIFEILHSPLTFRHTIESLGNVLRLRTIVALQHFQIFVPCLPSKGQKVKTRNARLRIRTRSPRRKSRATVVEIESFSDDSTGGIELRTKPAKKLSPRFKESKILSGGAVWLNYEVVPAK